jgi:nicotinate-nucleotide--dimethylbenzimidazole phosphoribosyltransferase
VTSLLDKTVSQIVPQDDACRTAARQRLDQLIMPHWALGRLMDLAVDLAGMTRSLRPPLARKVVVVMAGDHGVAGEGVSRYPQEVTGQMVHGFASGKAGINALARLAGARVVVVDVGVVADLGPLAAAGKILDRKIARGTANLAAGPAMTRQQALRAVETGIEIVEELCWEKGDSPHLCEAPSGPFRQMGTVPFFPEGVDLLAAGDMGIANSTPSAAVAAALTGLPAAELVGRGTGIDDGQLARKTAVVEKALCVNRPDPADGLDVLAKVGGFEIGGIAGIVLAAAARRKPVLVDGFISTAGALLAHALAPAATQYVIAAHRSVEPGHRAMQEHLGKRPLLDLDLRLGEGTGAVLAMHLVEAAGRILSEVATFEEAHVSRA